ncbi:MAG: aspartate-semialdehyde dehydrogenase [Anaerolineaceae bacterium]|nr:aspartate-semialdehyde dehydrogenase [Anaerolineaceae bacterium]
MRKIPAAILGATGVVGQRFIQMLAEHPWFEIIALVGSERSAGRTYAEASRWVIPGNPPEHVNEMPILPLDASIPGRVAFSALPVDVARQIEPRLAEAGFAVCSNAATFRLEPDVPVIIPEVNGDHIALLEEQHKNRGWKGLIVTSPNCTTTGIVMALKPLHQAYEVVRFMAVSFQAISGAGHPGVPFLDASDNLIPFIQGEEEKIERESRALLGCMRNGRRVDAEIIISAQSNRAPVLHGHTICLSVGFKHKPSPQEAIETLQKYRGPKLTWTLPSAPAHPVIVRHEPDRPQPRRDRDTDHGMVTTVGRVRSCPLLDLRLVSVVHNAIRGAAGGSVLNAELLVAAGYIK